LKKSMNKVNKMPKRTYKRVELGKHIVADPSLHLPRATYVQRNTEDGTLPD